MIRNLNRKCWRFISFRFYYYYYFYFIFIIQITNHHFELFNSFIKKKYNTTQANTKLKIITIMRYGLINSIKSTKHK